MIQVYAPDNTNFEKNGDCVLFPTSAEIHAILNSTWTATLSHPIDREGRWKFLSENAVVKMPSFLPENQLFRVKKRTVSDSGVDVEMEPIFYDSIGDCFLVDVRPTDKNGQEALDIITAVNPKYSGQSNITKISTAYYQFKNLLEAVNGEEENAFTQRWGGEILFDNYTIVVNDRVGADHGVELRYGKNLPQDGLTEDVDMTEVVTRIYPKAYNGYTMSGDGYVDSDLIGSYPVVFAKTITFDDVKMTEDAQTDDEENGVIVCANQDELNAALTQRCTEQYAAGLDKPTVTLTADIVLLQNTEQYKNYKVLESISLGDTVHCKHSRLGITTDARAIELTYDALKKKTSAVVLGNFEFNYFQNVSSTVNRVDEAIRPDGNLRAEQIYGTIDAGKASLYAMADIAAKQPVRAVLLEDRDPNSPTYGAMALGSNGFLIASARTADGSDWDWRTFGSGKGFSADLITAGSMVADRIQGGTLTLGGISNTEGVAEIRDNAGNTIVKMNSTGITLDNGASIIAADGVCGNLQYLSGGGGAKPLGVFNKGGSFVSANLYVAAYVPDNYVIEDARLILITGAATWENVTGGATITGYSRDIELNYSDESGVAIWGDQLGEWSQYQTNFEEVPSGLLGDFAGKPDGTANGTKTLKSANLKSLFTPGKMNMLEVRSASPSNPATDGYRYTGAGLAILNLIGYTRSE